MACRDRVSIGDWRQGWAELVDTFVRPIAQSWDAGETLIPRPDWVDAGIIVREDGSRRQTREGRAIFDEGFQEWVRGTVWSVLLEGGIPAERFLPATAEPVAQGLWLSACSRCYMPMWAEPPHGGRPGARCCSACRAAAERDRKRRQRGTDLSDRLCDACGESFTPKRSDARCCSGRCRAALSRRRALPGGDGG